MIVRPNFVEIEWLLERNAIVAPDIVRALLSHARALETALNNIATGTDIPGYTEEVADSEADCVYMFQDYARSIISPPPKDAG